MTMPNFLIIGAMKSGTTALYYYLEQHPEIYMSPVKEPNFFSSQEQENAADAVTHIEAYQHLFRGVSGERAIGEASPSYLYEPGATAEIRRYVPEAKLIAILRNPIDRAYSHFLHMVRSGTEPLDDFAQALREEEEGIHKERIFQDYIGRGLYYNQLKRYFGTFRREQVRVYLYEDLNGAPISTVQNAFRFLKVDDSFVPDVSLRRNVSGHPRYETLDRLLRNQSRIKHAAKIYLPARLRWRLSKAFDDLKTRNLIEPPPVQSEVRRQLIRVYREDILNVQELIHRDLSGWIE
jgi:sulfotransferase family protein